MELNVPITVEAGGPGGSICIENYFAQTLRSFSVVVPLWNKDLTTGDNAEKIKKLSVPCYP